MTDRGPLPGSWHVADELFASYVRGNAGAVAGTSLEQHLVHCATCRTRMADHVDPLPLDALWGRIHAEASAPQPSWMQRVLGRAHVSDGDALLLATAPSLRGSWFAGVVATLLFTMLADLFHDGVGVALFLLVAPLIPVAGVALAHGTDVDPSYEVTVAAPYSSNRLLLLRTAAVLVTSLPLALVAGLIPAYGRTGVLWLIPALAFTSVLLAASTWINPTHVAIFLACVWTVAVMSATRVLDPEVVLAPSLLLSYVGLGLAAALVLRVRISSLTMYGSAP
jgi:hypothetical protein